MTKNYKVTVNMVTNEIASTESLENSKTSIEENLYKKADTSLSNLDATEQAVIDAKLDREGNYTVVETYRYGATWYRVWSDGWIEQGGGASTPAASQSVRITFLKPFTEADAYFVGMLPFVGNTVVNNLPTPAVQARQTTYMDCSVGSYDSRLGAIAFCWYACGY